MLSSIRSTASILLALAVMAASASGAADTWTPLVSKVRQTMTEIPAEGPPVVKQLWEGVYLRSQTGSQLQKLERIKPGGYAAGGFFIDRPLGKSYRLSYPTKTAVLVQRSLSERIDRFVTRRRLARLGRKQDAFLGIPCFLLPAESTPEQSMPVQSAFPGVGGRSCYSAEYDLSLYWEVDTPGGTDLTIRHRQELYDLEIGRSPDERDVMLPDGFVVQENLD